MCNIFRSRKRRIIKFYKENGRWYADVPGVPKEDNEMIENSCEMLDFLCAIFNKRKDELFITVTEKVGSSMIRLKMLNVDEEGCTYIVDGGMFAGHFDWLDTEIWLCNITKKVFGRFPPYIYVLSVSGTKSIFSKIKKIL